MTTRTSREPPSQPVSEAGNYTNLSASELVRTGPGKLLGIFVASSSAGTIKLWDNTSAATTTIVNTFPVGAGVFYPIPCRFETGLYVTVGGTADVTVLWEPRQL